MVLASSSVSQRYVQTTPLCYKDSCVIWQEGMAFYLSMVLNSWNVSMDIVIGEALAGHLKAPQI